MKNHVYMLTTAAALGLGLVGTAAHAATLLVTNGNDAGDGSLRAALSVAADSSVASTIVLAHDGEVSLQSGLLYTGIAPVSIIGAGQVLRANGNFTLLSVTSGADLTITGLDLAGPGGFDINHRGNIDTPAGNGILLAVPAERVGTVALHLMDVSIRDVAGYGLHVSDCDLAQACGGGGGGAGGGSAASVAVFLSHVTIEATGGGRFDGDGLRVDERGAGDISLVARASRFAGNGADGVELDEGQDGDVTALILDSAFVDNGGYCAPDVMNAFLPEIDEAEFEDGAATQADVPGPDFGSPDDACLERAVDLYDSGAVQAYEIGLDLDDGFDIDEAGAGSVMVTLIRSTITGNLDEGLDFDEEDTGHIAAVILGTTASGNTDDGFKLSEADEGDITGLMRGAVARDNGGKGAVFEEEDAGDVDVTVIDGVSANNDDSDDTGLEVVQDDEGTGTLRITGSEIADGVDAEGVEVITN